MAPKQKHQKEVLPLAIINHVLFSSMCVSCAFPYPHVPGTEPHAQKMLTPCLPH